MFTQLETEQLINSYWSLQMVLTFFLKKKVVLFGISTLNSSSNFYFTLTFAEAGRNIVKGGDLMMLFNRIELFTYP